MDFDQTDERYGTMEDFKNLIKQVHRKNMHFVMDFPISTTSRKHAWLVFFSFDTVAVCRSVTSHLRRLYWYC